MTSHVSQELEDMILRIEKHFKAEQAARKKAEELLQASIAAELESKAKMEEVGEGVRGWSGKSEGQAEMGEVRGVRE
jgi:hypothetical protein